MQNIRESASAPQDTAMPVIDARGLSVQYNGKTVWSDADFQIHQGEFIAVLGPNGAGKSTLLRMLLGLLKPSKGTLDVLGSSPKRGNSAIGYVPQARMFDHETAVRGVDLVGFGVDGDRWGMPLFSLGEEARALRIEQAIASVGGTAYAKRRLGQLSGGERQRLFLAQALVGEPQLLLLDEPLASLDLRNQVVMAELVANLAKARNIAVLLVTHDLNPLLSVVDRVLYIGRHGVAIGKPEEVITSEVLSRLYGTNVDVVEDRHGRRFVVGLEDVMAHPHAGDHAHSHS